jgi:hypothetical protein
MGALSSGIAAGQSLSTGNAIGDVIKGILANARAQGLIQTQAQGNIDLARAKGEIGQTKGASLIDASGRATPVLDAEGNVAVFPKSQRLVTPREGKTEGERAFASEKGKLKAERLRQIREQGGGNIIEQSAGGTAAPVSNIINQQERTAPAGPIVSPEEQELIKLLDLLEAQ